MKTGQEIQAGEASSREVVAFRPSSEEYGIDVMKRSSGQIKPASSTGTLLSLII